ncbi:MAG: hypothetical protein E7356_01065 [Clostridiales bacterium]|nr:hypothetical protein [Clostridiales bacterium]
MNNRYFFDKRDWKRRTIKYGAIFLISFLPIVLFNILLDGVIEQNWIVILLDCILLLIFVVIGNWICEKIFEARDAKLERLRSAREEAESLKKQILEDSYKRKRQEKQENKKKKAGNDTESIDIEITEPDKKAKKNKGKATSKKPTIIKQTKEEE